MIPFLDYDETGLEKHVDDMIEIYEWGDQIAQIIVEFVILGHGVKDFDGTLEIAQEMAEYGHEVSPTSLLGLGSPAYKFIAECCSFGKPQPRTDGIISNRLVIAIQKDPRSLG